MISSFKNFDLSSIANDKVVVSMAFVGLAASTKYIVDKVIDLKSKPKSSKTS